MICLILIKVGDFVNTVDKISLLLEQKHLTQSQLSEYLGLKSYCVSEWKSGKTQSYKKYLEKIAQFLEVPVSELISDSSDSIKYGTDSGSKCSSQEDQTAFELLQAYYALSLKNKARALAYVCELVDNQETKI